MDTEAIGRKALSDALRNKVGLTPSYTSQLVTGAKSPSLDLALRIEEVSGIPPSIWRAEGRGAAVWEVLIAKAASERAA
jgi:hypothetical protein